VIVDGRRGRGGVRLEGEGRRGGRRLRKAFVGEIARRRRRASALLWGEDRSLAREREKKGGAKTSSV